jgi:hypothetical protein
LGVKDRIVARDMVFDHRNVRCIRNKDPLEFGIGNREPAHNNIAQAGEASLGNILSAEIVHAVNVNANSVVIARGVEDCVRGPKANQRQRLR